jgi:lambda repressor-like predicted transcriptional regulator
VVTSISKVRFKLQASSDVITLDKEEICFKLDHEGIRSKDGGKSINTLSKVLAYFWPRGERRTTVVCDRVNTC